MSQERPASRSAVPGWFVPWDGGCLFIGDHAGVVPMHAHYAIQIAFGSEHGIRFRTGEREPWTAYGGALIPSRQPHSMDPTDVRYNAVLFVEPETREGRTITERYLGGGGIAAVPGDVYAGAAQRLFATWLAGGDRAAINAAVWRVIEGLTGGQAPAVATDERILRAVEYVKAHLDAPLTLDEVAAKAYLSPSRFRHLFVEETGMALRPYILWRRFLRSWEVVLAGESLSRAAHESGFADAAHLTRTSRRMFGLAPSVMLSLRRQATVQAPAEATPAT